MKPDADILPPWTRILTEEDWPFLKRFVLASGSLKDLAAEYDISYPTVRNRLDRLIAKIALADCPGNKDDFRVFIRSLVIDGHLQASVAKEILRKHETSPRERNEDD